MHKELVLRTAKFPYFFWSFNRAYTCELDFTNYTYKNLEKQTHYVFKDFNSYAFLSLKYLPVLLVFYFCFSMYDFSFNQNTIVAYALAFILALSVNFLENLARKLTSTIILIFSFGIGFFMENYFLVAYVLKYFLLLCVFLIFYLDLGLKPFSLIENNKVISHFLLSKEMLREN